MAMRTAMSLPRSLELALTSADEKTSSPPTAAPSVAFTIAPINYGVVLPGCIYRSSFPQLQNHAFLGSLNLKTVLTLVPTPHPPEYVAFIQNSPTIKQHIVIELQTNKGTIGIEDATMSRLLEVVANPANYPMLIHCNKGKHRTGCLVGCFRLMGGMPVEIVVDEYHKYAGSKAREHDELFLRTRSIKKE